MATPTSWPDHLKFACYSPGLLRNFVSGPIAESQEWIEDTKSVRLTLTVSQEEYDQGSPPLKRFKHLDKVIEQR